MSQTGFNTVAPPNSIACGSGRSDGHCWAAGCQNVMPPDSYHPGGVNGLMADGSVHFFSETIDTGYLNDPTRNASPTSGESPYGVWGALGTRSSGEAKSL
jgi:prepilin-type processing-associated H-X9-DG protein